MECNQGNKAQVNPVELSKPSKPHDDAIDEDKKSKSSSLDTWSSDENTADHFSLLELQDNFASAIYKVDSLDQKVASLDSKLDQKLQVLNLS